MLIDAVAGLTEILSRLVIIVEETVNVRAGLVIPSRVAVIKVVPGAMADANPPDKDVTPLAIILDTAIFELTQVTESVIFLVLLSEYVPVAVNCIVSLIFKGGGFGGDTVIAVRVTFWFSLGVFVLSDSQHPVMNINKLINTVINKKLRLLFINLSSLC